jgi:hypothetical protein
VEGEGEERAVFIGVEVERLEARRGAGPRGRGGRGGEGDERHRGQREKRGEDAPAQCRRAGADTRSGTHRTSRKPARRARATMIVGSGCRNRVVGACELRVGASGTRR